MIYNYPEGRLILETQLKLYDITSLCNINPSLVKNLKGSWEKDNYFGIRTTINNIIKFYGEEEIKKRSGWSRYYISLLSRGGSNYIDSLKGAYNKLKKKYISAESFLRPEIMKGISIIPKSKISDWLGYKIVNQKSPLSTPPGSYSSIGGIILINKIIDPIGESVTPSDLYEKVFPDQRKILERKILRAISLRLENWECYKFEGKSKYVSHIPIYFSPTSSPITNCSYSYSYNRERENFNGIAISYIALYLSYKLGFLDEQIKLLEGS